ncbi:MAG: serine--tRNA ligase [Spirochaetia bacterium]|nr:serine--tRNA ligase [Spirochaetia bacterium]
MINRELLKTDEGIAIILENIQKRQMNDISMNIEKIINSYKINQLELERLQSQRNKISKEIGSLGGGEKTQTLKEEVKIISDKIKNLKEETLNAEEKYNNLQLNLPNILHEKVPLGKTEEDNQVVREFGKKPEFNFTPMPHYEIGEKNNLFDFERAAKLSGSRFYVYNERLARLERDLISFMLKEHEKKSYKERLVPFLVNDECMINTGQYPKFKEEYYRLERDDLNLIPTAEVPLTNLYSNEIFKEEDLPLYLTAATPCFRREAGSAGKDTRGLIRVHQFNKVELVKFCKPENSDEELESLLADAESILQKLNLHYRVALLCSADTSFSSSITYDLEIWMPGAKRWLEISSCSNFKDFQARRGLIRYKNSKTGKNDLVHTLNGSGVAAGRLMAALLEYYQTESGDIKWSEIYDKIQ